MRAILQRVSQAAVTSEGETLAKQGRGFLILLGVTTEDTTEDLDWLVRKIAHLRVFEDDGGKMNLSIIDVQGEITVVSQFTLFASTKKGNRPSFLEAARPEISQPLYEQFCDALSAAVNRTVGKGRFGAMMEVSLTNDGPVTLTLDSKSPQ